MLRSLWHVTGLRQRLIFSYLLVALIFAATFSLGFFFFIDHSNENVMQPVDVQPVAEVLAPQIAPYLQQHPLNTKALTRWAQSFVQRTGPSFSPENIIWSLIPNVSQVSCVQIVDQQGSVVATVSGTPHQQQDELATSQAQTIMKSVRGQSIMQHDNSMVQSHVLPGGKTLIVVPVWSQDQYLLGVLSVVLVETRTPQHSPYKGLIIPFLVILLPAGIISLLAGTFISQDITRRIQQITHAAHTWSQGNFTVTVRDTAQDELGQLSHDLNTMATQIRLLLAARQELAIVEERQRLARDLHDSIKQQLFVLTLLVGTVRSHLNPSSPAEQTLGEIATLVGQIHHELAALIHALRPVTLDKGLNSALREYSQSWSQSTGITIQLHLTDALSLSFPVEQAIFRIVQEALSNVARHSEATCVEIFLSQENDHVSLRIKDNGHGFDLLAKKGSGVGLNSMQERTLLLNGNLNISSTPSGTLLDIRIPSMEQGETAHGTSNHLTDRR